MTRRAFLASLAAPAMRAQAGRKPNIVFILADDLGLGDLGCYGGKVIRTPNIDRMAAEGIRFTQAYAGASVCAPSRNCLMTGQHLGHATIRANHSLRTGERVPLAAEDVTVAQVLKKAGYATGIFGKWGLGEPDTAGVPERKGFDEWLGFLNQDHAVDYYTDHLWRNGRKETIEGNRNGARKMYVHDLFTTEALRFIGAHKARPFFLYLAYTTPHEDHMVPDLAPYREMPWPERNKIYAAMVTRLDRDVGRVIEEIGRQGLERDTLVIFASDNGAATKNDVAFFKGTLGLRAAKGSIYEGGIRVPAIARWPGRTPAGKVSEFPWAFCDFLPTAADLAGIAPPAGVDGISIAAELTGQEQTPHEYLYWENFSGKNGAFQQAIRMGNWKGVAAPGKAFELYDLAADPAEAHDVAAKQPEVVARMNQVLQKARTENPEYPASGRRKSRQ